MQRVLLLLIVSSVVALAAMPAAADMTYGFYNITNNKPPGTDVANQLSVKVIDLGLQSGQVAFRFFNNVGIASSITDIYFDDGTLLGIASISDSGSGVAFSPDASPPDLPGGNNAAPPFVTTAGFLADSDSPHLSENGVDDAEEWVQILFTLKRDEHGIPQTFADVINDLDSGALRIGLHVQGIGDKGEGSDSFVNMATAVPAPAGIVVGLLGLALVGWTRRRQV